jgi:hypothetical protein
VENEAELGVSFGPNPGAAGAMVHFSTTSLTCQWPPPKESLREPLLDDCLGPSGLGSPAWGRNCAITLKTLVAKLAERPSAVTNFRGCIIHIVNDPRQLAPR